MDQDQALAAFGALSQSTRFHMIRALVTAAPQGLSAGDVAEQTGASPSRASFHLSTLADAGLVTSEKRARTVIYRVSFDGLGALTAFLLHDCCRGNAQVRACCEERQARAVASNGEAPCC